VVRGSPGHAGDRRVVELLDSYSAHLCEEPREISETMKIDMLLVPAGSTDMLPPWDCSARRVLKAIRHGLCRCEGAGQLLRQARWPDVWAGLSSAAPRRAGGVRDESGLGALAGMRERGRCGVGGW
jgi:hypothetical protein